MQIGRAVGGLSFQIQEDSAESQRPSLLSPSVDKGTALVVNFLQFQELPVRRACRGS
jgi:hypothetical protein